MTAKTPIPIPTITAIRIDPVVCGNTEPADDDISIDWIELAYETGQAPTPTITHTPAPETPTATATPTYTPDPCPKGDPNCDGDITPGDALLAFQIYLKIYVPTGEEPCDVSCAADWDENGNITPGDALCIFREYLNNPC